MSFFCHLFYCYCYLLTLLSSSCSAFAILPYCLFLQSCHIVAILPYILCLVLLSPSYPTGAIWSYCPNVVATFSCCIHFSYSCDLELMSQSCSFSYCFHFVILLSPACPAIAIWYYRPSLVLLVPSCSTVSILFHCCHLPYILHHVILLSPYLSANI